MIIYAVFAVFAVCVLLMFSIVAGAGLYAALALHTLIEAGLIGAIGWLAMRASSATAAQSYARNVQFSMGGGKGLQYRNQERRSYQTQDRPRKAHQRATPTGGTTRVAATRSPQRMRVRSVAIPLLVATAATLLAGCNDVAADCFSELCNAQRDAALQAVRDNAALQHNLAGVLIALQWSNVATLIILCVQATMFGWRRFALGNYSADERWQHQLDATTMQQIAAAQPPASVAYNYAALPAADDAIDGDWREIEDEPLPTAPTWAQVKASGFVATPKRILIGYAASGPLYVSLEACPAMIVIGRPTRGKSTWLRLLLAQVQQMGAHAVLLDPHGSVAPTGAANVATANHVATIEAAAQKLAATLDYRLSRYVAGDRQFAALFCVADELPALAKQAPATIDVINRCILEGRKVGIYVAIAGQGAPAQLLGGSLARDSVALRVAFAQSSRQAAMVGFDADAATAIATLEQPGMAYADGPFAATLIAVPNVAESDLVQRPATQPATPATPMQHARVADVAPATPERDTTELPLPPELQAALDAYNAGATSIRKLAAALQVGRYVAEQRLRRLSELRLTDWQTDKDPDYSVISA